MTRRLGGYGRNGLAVFATLSLAAALAGGTMVGCSSSNPSGTGLDPAASADVGTGLRPGALA